MDDNRQWKSEVCSICRYGDPSGRKLHILAPDLEQKWMDMHGRETGVKIPID
jgi:hypothetical protein